MSKIFKGSVFYAKGTGFAANQGHTMEQFRKLHDLAVAAGYEVEVLTPREDDTYSDEVSLVRRVGARKTIDAELAEALMCYLAKLSPNEVGYLKTDDPTVARRIRLWWD